MTQAYAELLRCVHDVRRHWRLRRLLDGAMLTTAIVGCTLAAMILLDQVMDGSRVSRCIMALLVLSAAMGSLAWWMVRPGLRKLGDDYFAALVEQRCPASGNRVINALQLGRETADTCPNIIDAIVGEGAAAMQDIPLGRIVRPERPWRSFIILVAMLALAAAVFGTGGPAARTSLRRILFPMVFIEPFTWTQVTLLPADAVRLLEGGELEITANLAGKSVPDASLTWTDTHGRRRSVAMRRETDSHFTYRFGTVVEPMTLYAHAGDGRSNPLRVAVDPRPRVIASSVTYRYPAYAHLADRTVEANRFDGQIAAIPGTSVTLNLQANKQLDQLRMILDHGQPLAAQQDGVASRWSVTFTLSEGNAYHWQLLDRQGHDVADPTRFGISVVRDEAPMVVLVKPGRDMQLKPEDSIAWQVAARDDLGIGSVQLLGCVNPQPNSTTSDVVLQDWPRKHGEPSRQVSLDVSRTIASLQLKPGDRLQYWAAAVDLNDIAPAGPGRAESRRYNLLVLTPQQAQALLDKQLADYAQIVTELLRLQRLNRVSTESLSDAMPLVDRQSQIREQSLKLADAMQQAAFPGLTIIDELRHLATGPMAAIVAGLERYRDARELDQRKAMASATLADQDAVIASLEDILKRLSRDAHVRRVLRKMDQTDPAAKEQIASELTKLGDKLDKFLGEQREAAEKYEKLPKPDDDKVSGEDLVPLTDVEHRMDRWKQWFKDSVDAITKLPRGFAEDSQLAETVSTIFEEVEKKPRKPTKEIATPIEEGAKWVGTEILEDLEIWMPDRGDNLKWVMEDPLEGNFEVPEATLPDNLQDMVGDLIEDVQDFDEEADDVTGAWGGNMPQTGWDAADGPMSTFGATGITGNQLPNASELTGRAGGGRRGRSSGQMAGSDYAALEGRPTPARVTSERYDEGHVNAAKQLDPRGATGGGKKTGAGQRGLQGSSPPDFVKDMQRLQDKYRLLQEKSERLANQMMSAGRPVSRVNRAMQILETSQQDLRDLRYEDSARKRQQAIGELKAQQDGIDQAVSLSLQKARLLPPELRPQITAGTQQAMPEGYEKAVGDYFNALSEAAQPKP
ncbi:MAG: hypothetical protein IT440_13100 [Phycisphaeraceae bacterium]|nr:hypothetical protein [Phycisphaeraceae bacterium]